MFGMKDVGQKFGRLTLLRWIRDDRTAGGKKMPVCLFRCDCGAECAVRIYSVRSGKTKSCGCLHREGASSLRHGHTSGRLSPEWRAWRDMLTRATNANIAHARHYVDRGIGVCPEWAYGGDGNGFLRFLDHVGEKPTSQHSLDRIDVNRGYEPGNVRWATRIEQARNKRYRRTIHIGRRELALSDAAEEYGLSAKLIADRIDKLGWPIKRALAEPVRKIVRRK